MDVFDPIELPDGAAQQVVEFPGPGNAQLDQVAVVTGQVVDLLNGRYGRQQGQGKRRARTRA